MLKNQDKFSNEIIYHILIDRFSEYDSSKNWKEPIFCGGTLKGIKKKIPYLKNLGITTIWISPFYKTNAYHGYHITDFFLVDPHFGSDSDLKVLIEKIHENEMKIIADFVPNHCSKYHPFFIDAQQNKKSPYQRWFYFTKWPNEYLSFLSFPEIPKLNLDNQETYEYILNAAKHWMSFGLDGFRLDHVIGPSYKFWKRFTREIKKQNQQFLLIGEAWMAGIKYHELKTINMKRKRLLWFFGANSDRLLRLYINYLDGVLDFNAQQLILKNIALHSKRTISNLLHKHYKKFPSSFILPLFLDNHDMDRFLFSCNNNVKLLQKAAEIQFSINQPVIIYYGTEIGMSQEKSIWCNSAHGDILAREPMRWNEINHEVLLFYQQLCQKHNHKSK